MPVAFASDAGTPPQVERLRQDIVEFIFAIDGVEERRRRGTGHCRDDVGGVDVGGRCGGIDGGENEAVRLVDAAATGQIADGVGLQLRQQHHERVEFFGTAHPAQQRDDALIHAEPREVAILGPVEHVRCRRRARSVELGGRAFDGRDVAQLQAAGHQVDGEFVALEPIAGSVVGEHVDEDVVAIAAFRGDHHRAPELTYPNGAHPWVGLAMMGFEVERSIGGVALELVDHRPDLALLS